MLLFTYCSSKICIKIPTHETWRQAAAAAKLFCHERSMCFDVGIQRRTGHMMRWGIPHCAPFKIVEKKLSRNYSHLIKITLKNSSKETPPHWLLCCQSALLVDDLFVDDGQGHPDRTWRERDGQPYRTWRETNSRTKLKGKRRTAVPNLKGDE